MKIKIMANQQTDEFMKMNNLFINLFIYEQHNTKMSSWMCMWNIIINDKINDDLTILYKKYENEENIRK
jgi:hypothetical protein